MKIKILAQLSAKFPGVQKSLLDRVADTLASTVTEDAQIETAVANSAGLVSAFAAFHQSEADRRVTEAVKAREDVLNAEITRLKGAGTPDPKPTDPTIETPEQKQLKELIARFSAMDAEKTGITLMQKAKDGLKAKGMTESAIALAVNGRSFAKDEDIEVFVTTTETAYQATLQELQNQGLNVNQQPFVSTAASEKAVEADIKAWAEANKPKAV